MSSVLGSIVLIFSATVASKLFGVVRSFWLARILDPADYGVWIFVFLISSYAPLVSLGMGEALLKKVPFFLGRKDNKSVREVEGGVLSFTILLTIIFLPIAAFLPRILSMSSLQRFILPVQLMLVAVCFSFFSGYFTLRLQAYQRFSFLSAVTTARAIALLLLQIALSYFFGLIGAVLGFLLCEAIVCFYSGFLNRKIPNPQSVRFSVPLYGNLIRTGLPITIVWWTYVIQTSVDRIVSMSMLGDAPTGFYGIGMSIAVTFLLIPDSINQVLYPNVNKRYGQTSRKKDLIPLVVEPARIMSLLLPLLAFLSLLLLPLMFRFIVPKYIPGLQATQILILAALYSGMTKGGTNLLISVDKRGRLIIYIIASILLNLCGNISLVKLGFGINGIALSTAISSALLAIAIWFSVLENLHYAPREAIRMIAGMFWPALLFTVVFLMNYIFLRPVQVGSLTYIVVTVASFFLYSALLFAVPSYRDLMRSSVRSGITALKSRKNKEGTIGPPSTPDEW